jgi:hypothetical protein
LLLLRRELIFFSHTFQKYNLQYSNSRTLGISSNRIDFSFEKLVVSVRLFVVIVDGKPAGARGVLSSRTGREQRSCLLF